MSDVVDEARTRPDVTSPGGSQQEPGHGVNGKLTLREREDAMADLTSAPLYAAHTYHIADVRRWLKTTGEVVVADDGPRVLGVRCCVVVGVGYYAVWRLEGG